MLPFMGTMAGKLLGGLGIAAFADKTAPVSPMQQAATPYAPYLERNAPQMPGALSSLYGSQGQQANLPQGYESSMRDRLAQFEQSQELSLSKARRRQMDVMASMGIGRSTDAAAGMGEIEAAGLSNKAQFQGGLEQNMMGMIQDQQNQQNQLLSGLYGAQMNFQLGTNQNYLDRYRTEVQSAQAQNQYATSQYSAQSQRQQGIGGFLSKMFF